MTRDVPLRTCIFRSLVAKLVSNRKITRHFLGMITRALFSKEQRNWGRFAFLLYLSRAEEPISKYF